MKTNIIIPFASDEDAQHAISILKSEVDFKGRATAHLSREGNSLIISISADDISALHATTSSFMRALKVILPISKHEMRKTE